MMEIKAFIAKLKHQNYESQQEECVCCAQSHKKWRLLQESQFVQFEGQTLIFKEMVERKTFLVKSYIQMRRTCLQCPIMRRIKII